MYIPKYILKSLGCVSLATCMLTAITQEVTAAAFYSTGVSNSIVIPYNYGISDLHYTVTRYGTNDPNGTYLGYAKSAFTYGWHNNTNAIVHWITPQVNATNGPLTYTNVVRFKYTTSINLTNLDASKSVVSGYWGAVNGGGIYLNVADGVKMGENSWYKNLSENGWI